MSCLYLSVFLHLSMGGISMNLTMSGISGTGYVPSGKWVRVSSSAAASSHASGFLHFIQYTAISYREKVIDLYRKLGFEGDELAVLSALTVGEKADLSESIRESYSVSGASHILALSGLHIGLLYALFFLLLKPLVRRWRGIRYFRSVLIVVFCLFYGTVSICSPFSKYVFNFDNC